MKTLIKKAGMIIATLLLAMQMYGAPVYAAEGDISFTDPSAEVGEKVDVTVRVFSATTQLGKIKLNMKYNPQLLKFEQGTNAVDNNGNIDLSADLDAGTSDVTFVLTFTTLKEGTTKITVSDYTATNADGTNVELKAWDSTVTIGEGGPVEEAPKEAKEEEKDKTSITVDGENYTVNSSFSDKEIPAGFEQSEGQIDGKKVTALYNKQSGIYLYSLKNQSGETNLFLSDESDASLKKTVVVDVSMDKYIMIIDPNEKVSLPEKYQSTTMTLNGTEFSIWNNVEDQDYYLIYALNMDGKPGYYQYDAIENTYQRCNQDLSVKKENKNAGILAKAAQYTSEHILEVICVVTALVVILLLIIIILIVKLVKKGTPEEFYAEEEEELENDRDSGHAQIEEDEEYEDIYEEDEDLSDYEMEFDDYYDEEEFEEEEVEEHSADEKAEDEFLIDFIEL